MNRTPQEWIVNAQLHLMYQRRSLRFIEQKEWEVLTEAIEALEKCLKEVIRRGK